MRGIIQGTAEGEQTNLARLRSSFATLTGYAVQRSLRPPGNASKSYRAWNSAQASFHCRLLSRSSSVRVGGRPELWIAAFKRSMSALAMCRKLTLLSMLEAAYECQTSIADRMPDWRDELKGSRARRSPSHKQKGRCVAALLRSNLYHRHGIRIHSDREIPGILHGSAHRCKGVRMFQRSRGVRLVPRSCTASTLARCGRLLPRSRTSSVLLSIL